MSPRGPVPRGVQSLRREEPCGQRRHLAGNQRHRGLVRHIHPARQPLCGASTHVTLCPQAVLQRGPAVLVPADTHRRSSGRHAGEVAHRARCAGKTAAFVGLFNRSESLLSYDDVNTTPLHRLQYEEQQLQIWPDLAMPFNFLHNFLSKLVIAICRCFH